MTTVTILIYGAAVCASFACGWASCAWCGRKSVRDAVRVRADAGDAIKATLQACREVLNEKQFSRVRRRALEIGAELEAKRKAR